MSHPETELAGLKSVYEQEREPALRAGVRLEAQRFEVLPTYLIAVLFLVKAHRNTQNSPCPALQVHRFDTPLVYGRTMVGDPVQSEAFALCRMSEGPNGKPAYGAITFVSVITPIAAFPRILGHAGLGLHAKLLCELQASTVDCKTGSNASEILRGKSQAFIAG